MEAFCEFISKSKERTQDKQIYQTQNGVCWSYVNVELLESGRVDTNFKRMQLPDFSVLDGGSTTLIYVLLLWQNLPTYKVCKISTRLYYVDHPLKQIDEDSLHFIGYDDTKRSDRGESKKASVDMFTVTLDGVYVCFSSLADRHLNGLYSQVIMLTAVNTLSVELNDTITLQSLSIWYDYKVDTVDDSSDFNGEESALNLHDVSNQNVDYQLSTLPEDGIDFRKVMRVTLEILHDARIRRLSFTLNGPSQTYSIHEIAIHRIDNLDRRQEDNKITARIVIDIHGISKGVASAWACLVVGSLGWLIYKRYYAGLGDEYLKFEAELEKTKSYVTGIQSRGSSVGLTRSRTDMPSLLYNSVRGSSRKVAAARIESRLMSKSATRQSFGEAKLLRIYSGDMKFRNSSPNILEVRP